MCKGISVNLGEAGIRELTLVAKFAVGMNTAYIQYMGEVKHASVFYYYCLYKESSDPQSCT